MQRMFDDEDYILANTLRQSLEEYEDDKKQKDEQVQWQEEEDLKLGIAMSLSLTNEHNSISNDLTSANPDLDINKQSAPNNDKADAYAEFRAMRKQLEEERLSRLRKRKINDTEDIIEPGSRLKVKTAIELRGNLSMESKNRISTPTISKHVDTSNLSFVANETSSYIHNSSPLSLKAKTQSRMKYTSGTLKLTHIDTFSGDYITFSNLIDKAYLKKGIISTFIVEPSWLLTEFPKDIPLCIIMDRKSEEVVSPSGSFITIHPPMIRNDWGVMHAKLLVLWFDDFARIVIGSGNLIWQDWASMENIVFVQDLPLLPKDRCPPKFEDISSRFGHDLADMLLRMTVPENFSKDLLQIDFDPVKAILVPSISGAFQGEDLVNRFGHPCLAAAVRSIGAADPSWVSEKGSVKGPVIEYQTSSLGTLSTSYLQEFYRSCCGIKIGSKLNKPTGKTVQKDEIPPITVVYPSRSTVMASQYKDLFASTICFPEKYYLSEKFPKGLLKDCISRRKGTLMHSKFILARLRAEPTLCNDSDNEKNRQKNDEVYDFDGTIDGGNEAKERSSIARLMQERAIQYDKVVVGWVYCGSHNFTASAWGNLTISRETKQPKLSMNNWELGVVMPVYDRAGPEVNDISKQADWFVERGVPVSFINSVKYSEEKEPWFGY